MSHKMSFEDVVNSRQSVRGYKSDPVPREVIEEIIDVACGNFRLDLYNRV